MGRKSVKQNKTIYQQVRESCNLTRDDAADILTISAHRIYRIEDGSPIHPDEVCMMARVYNEPTLYNYYCSRECPIGKERKVCEIKNDNIFEILVNMNVCLTEAMAQRDRLMAILADGNITQNEEKEFDEIRKTLNSMLSTIESLKLWVEKND